MEMTGHPQHPQQEMRHTSSSSEEEDETTLDMGGLTQPFTNDFWFTDDDSDKDREDRVQIH